MAARIYYKKSVGGEWAADGKMFSDRRVVITLPNAAMKYDGTYHDVTLTLSNIFLKGQHGSTEDEVAIFKQSAYNLAMCCERKEHSEPLPGVTYDVEVSIKGATDKEKLFLAFMDIDQPGMNSDYSQVFPKGCREGIKIKSGIFPNTCARVPNDHTLEIITGSQPIFYSTRNTDPEESWKAAMSYIATANGTKFSWGGYTCATMFGTPMSDLSKFTINTKVRVEGASSPVNPTDSKPRVYSSYTEKNSKTFLSLMSATYNYDYTVAKFKSDYGVSSDNNWEFNFSGKSVGESGLRDNKTYYISINRKRWTWSFDSNLPTGASAKDLSNMPDAKTVVASRTSYGKADETVKSPKLKNWTFQGWNDRADGSGNWYKADYITSNKTWYAIWDPGYYYVVYCANDGSGRTWTNNQKYYFGKTYTPIMESTEHFYRKGYHMTHWSCASKNENYYCNPDYPAATYNLKTSFKDLTTVKGATVYINAEWARNPYRLRIYENFENQHFGRFNDYQLYWDEKFQLPKPQPWQHDALVYGYDFNWDSRVGAEYKLGQYVLNLTDLYNKADDRSNPILTLYTIWDLHPTITLSTSEIHLSQLKVASKGLNINNGTVSKSDLEAELMNYATVYDYEWSIRFPGTIPPGETNSYTYKIASFEPADIRNSARNDDADTYYVTFQVTDDANQSATAVLTLYVGNLNVDILVR